MDRCVDGCTSYRTRRLIDNECTPIVFRPHNEQMGWELYHRLAVWPLHCRYLRKATVQPVIHSCVWSAIDFTRTVPLTFSFFILLHSSMRRKRYPYKWNYSILLRARKNKNRFNYLLPVGTWCGKWLTGFDGTFWHSTFCRRVWSMERWKNATRCRGETGAVEGKTIQNNWDTSLNNFVSRRNAHE